MEIAETLMEEIEKAPRGVRAEQAANDLLREFFRGYPVEHLRFFLNSQDVDVVSTGVWIASELGERNKSILADVLRLLDHPVKKVRFWALDCLFWATPENSADFAKGVTMLEDVESSIRWKALDLTARLSASQLEAALNGIKLSNPTSDHLTGLEFLLNQDSRDPDLIISNLKSASPILRKYGLIAAVRSPGLANEALEYAKSIQDPDIQSFLRTKFNASS